MNPYLVIVLGALAGRFLLDLAADLLNLRNVRPDLPGEFKGVYDAERYRRSQEYLRDQTRFGFVTDAFFSLLTVLFILLGGFNAVDRLARLAGLGPIPAGLLFTGMLVLGLRLLHIPFSVYSTFVIEERYGFNKTTPRTFVFDILKTWLLMALIGAPILALVLWLFQAAGAAAWVYAWIAMTGIQVLLVFAAPVLIMPLFNKYEPLEDGELRDAIEAYARARNFTMKGVYKMDGSRRSAKTNAFFTGFGKSRRIVLFDTLIAKHSVPELVWIIGHEMGHYRKKHILQAIVRGIARTGIVFWLLSLVLENPRLFAAFRMDHVSLYASLVFFGFLYTPIAMALGMLEQAISRRQEYEADAYAAATCGSAQAGVDSLKKLSVTNLSNLTPHPFKVFLDYSHPPVLQRIAALRKLDAANSGKRRLQ